MHGELEAEIPARELVLGGGAPQYTREYKEPKYLQKIKDTCISQPDWMEIHWKTIQQYYAKAPCFPEYREFFEALFLGATDEHLSRINYRFLAAVCKLLGIDTSITWSTDYSIVEGKTERLVSLCQQCGATEYLSGPAAREYIQEELFQDAGISLNYMSYTGYEEYPQLYPPFTHFVSIVDLIFNMGPNASNYLLSFRS